MDSLGPRSPIQVRRRDWWVVLLWGLAACALGLLLIVRPSITAIVLVRVMAAFWLLGGLVDVVGALVHHERSVPRLLIGILSALAGAAILAIWVTGPSITIAIQYYTLGAVAIIYGIIMMLNQSRGRWSWAQLVLGMLQTAIGVMLLAHPTASILGFLDLLGALIVTGGLFAIVLSIRVQRAAGRR